MQGQLIKVHIFKTKIIFRCNSALHIWDLTSVFFKKKISMLTDVSQIIMNLIETIKHIAI